jgi:hypothetical protein
MSKLSSDNDVYEPIEQRKARAIKERRIAQLYTHIFHSGCAMIATNLSWHRGKLEDDEYHEGMVNQWRSIIYNAIEISSGKRPNKL